MAHERFYAYYSVFCRHLANFTCIYTNLVIFLQFLAFASISHFHFTEKSLKNKNRLPAEEFPRAANSNGFRDNPDKATPGAAKNGNKGLKRTGEATKHEI